MAVFAQAALGRLLLVQLLVALGFTLALCWAINSAWFSVVTRAIEKLPPTGDIVDGVLQWTNAAPVTLAENSYFSIVVDPEHRGTSGQISDLQLEFGKTELRVRGLLGWLEFPYPSSGVAAFNRTDLVPWWGAWRQAVLGIILLVVTLGLLLLWAIMAIIYAVPVRLLAGLAGRRLNWTAAWRLASAALLSGAVLMTAAVILYGAGYFDLVRVGFFFVFHVLVGWVYLAISPLGLPAGYQYPPPAKGGPAGSRQNPFQAASARPESKPANKENPFASP